MLDFSLTDEQQEIAHMAHSLAIEHLRVQGRICEKSGDISPALLQTLAQTGLATPFPEKYGGSGLINALTYVLIAEELGFGDTGLAMNIIGSMMGPLTIALAGNEQQQAQFLPAFCAAADSVQARGSLAFVERSGGYTCADIATTLGYEGQCYLINGAKRDVIHGRESHPCVVILRFAETSDLAGICACILPASPGGLQIVPDTQKLGLAAAPTASLIFSDTLIAEVNLLGEPGQSNVNVLRALALYAILRAAVATGTARAAFEYASRYAEERMAFGRPIVSYQGIAFMIAEMAMKLDAVRLLIWHAAASWDQSMKPVILLRDAEAAQRQALKIAQAITTDAIQIMGGAGFMQDHPVEMWMRNVAAME